jgi:protein-disulfide isomerase
MRTVLRIAIIGAVLALTGCGDKGAGDQAGNSAGGTPVAAVPAPNGTLWSDTVAATDAGGYVMGNPAAALKLIEYASFTCPHCRDFAAQIDEPLRKYVDSGKVSFEFRNFVRDPIDMSVALLARCGGKETFFPLSHQFFANQDAMFKGIQGAGEPAYQAAMKKTAADRFVALSEMAGLIEFVKARGITDGQARTCLADLKAAQVIADGNDIATKQFNLEGTPTLILNGQKLDTEPTWPALEAKLKAAGA